MSNSQGMDLRSNLKPIGSSVTNNTNLVKGKN
jgi:hypothetical protein